MAFHVPEKFRVRTGALASNEAFGNNGLFMCKLKHHQVVRVVAGQGLGWEHVSVSRQDRCPTWSEMCEVKALFWDDDDVVMQLHPAKSEHISNHDNCLHLWRPIDAVIPVPPPEMVGIKGVTAAEARRLVLSGAV